MRRLLTTALVALAAVLLLAPGNAAAATAQVSPVAGDVFPYRSFALTLPTGRDLSANDVTVRENGRQVSRQTLTPAHSAGDQDFATVLVIDTSASMRGRPIRDAQRAAAAFARKRNTDQQLGIVTFDRAARVALPLTTDGGAIATALETTPQLGQGTHLYDAVAEAVGLLKDAHIRAGSILLLSDGADTDSRLQGSQVEAAAQAAGVRIFAVGLESSSFDRRALASLAAGAHGDYAEAQRSSQLTPIFSAIGTRLANEYLIRYRSLAGRGSPVRVEVAVAGVDQPISTDYVTPPLASASLRTSEPSGFWSSTASMLLASFLCAFLVGAGVVLIQSRRRRARTETVSERMQGFVSAPPAEDPDTPTLTGRMLGEADRSLDETDWWPSFKEQLDIARIEMPAIRIVTLTALATLLAMLGLFALSGSPVVSLLALAIPPSVRALVISRADKQRRLFAEQLADNLHVIASGMRAGHSFAGAMSLAVDESPEPAKSELARVVADERLGVPLEDALEVVARRMQNDDLRQAVTVATLQRETGGNTAEVIDRVAETIRERGELRRIVRTLTAQGRLSRWVVTFLPVGLLAIITAINPGYMEPLFTTATGQTLLVLGVGMLAAGSLLIKRIVDFDV